MQHSNCYSNVKNIDHSIAVYKFEYGGYLIVKLTDL